ncbi:MAG: hypothetical protein JXR64_07005 [Spirochaetales bacterium]|nr:hypothetical protein [Spirochaetales bacterium]
MSVYVECFNVIVKRKALDRVYPGGSEKIIVNDNVPEEFYDDHLVRYGSMNVYGIDDLVSNLK